MTAPTGFEKLCYVPDMAQVREARRMTEREIFLELSMPGGRPLAHAPGQFVQVSFLGIGEVPISICSSPTLGGVFHLCIRQTGVVTQALQQVDCSESLGIRGPFGRGFPLAEMRGRDLLLVAGGLGMAPMRSLVAYVLDRRGDFGRVALVYGARSPQALLFKEDLSAWGRRGDLELALTVDEPDAGWQGMTGPATEPLAGIELDPDRTLAAVVGPPVLYRYAAAVLLERGLTPETIFFSLERNFHCGIGKCGHCQLNDLYVCRDGPVFRLSRLLDRIEAVEAWAPEDDQDR